MSNITVSYVSISQTAGKLNLEDFRCIYVTWMMRKLDGIKVRECVHVDTRAIKAHIHSTVATTQCIEYITTNEIIIAINHLTPDNRVERCRSVQSSIKTWIIGIVIILVSSWFDPPSHTLQWLSISTLNGSYPWSLRVSKIKEGFNTINASWMT